MFSPVDGEFVEANEALTDEPGTVNEAAETDGWIAKVRVDAAVVEADDALMSADEYAKHCEDEEH